MSWFRVDDRLAMHRKVLAAGNTAMGLWVRCGAYCAQHLTDGVIPREVALSFGTAGLAARLVSAGLWDVHPEGWVMRDYLDWNPSREKVLADRESAKRRANEWRSQSARTAHAQGTNSASAGSPSRPVPPPFQGGEGRGRLKAVPPTPTANQPRCPVHPHELAHNCRSCAADMKAGGL